MYMIRTKHFGAIALAASMLATLMLTGCSSAQKAANYFENADTVLVGQPLPTYALRIKAGDELRIVITSMVPEATAMYNVSPFYLQSPDDKARSSEQRLLTYRVTPEGIITLPVLGDISAVGKTTEALRQEIIARVSEQVVDPIVSVEFTTASVLVLGHVGGPGRVSFDGQRMSVLDAIGRAGGIPLSAVKERVRLVREQDGRVITHVYDLTDANIVNSPYYYLQQNDVLMVEANDIAKTNATYNQMNGFRLSVISTVVSALSVVASLIIALSR